MEVFIGQKRLKEDFKALTGLPFLECKIAFVLHS